MAKKVTHRNLYYESAMANPHYNSERYRDEIIVSLERWRCNQPYREVTVLHYLVRVGDNVVVDDRKLMPTVFSNSQVIRKAIAKFDELLANHPNLPEEKDA